MDNVTQLFRVQVELDKNTGMVAIFTLKGNVTDSFSAIGQLYIWLSDSGIVYETLMFDGDDLGILLKSSHDDIKIKMAFDRTDPTLYYYINEGRLWSRGKAPEPVKDVRSDFNMGNRYCS